MPILHTLAPYEDERGNRIEYAGTPVAKNVAIEIKGSNNTLVVHERARIKELKVYLHADNGRIEIGRSRRGLAMLALVVRAGQDSTVALGRDVTTTARALVSATEGTSVRIGDDVMFASGNEVRADDAHAIFDVDTDQRVNVSRSIVIGNHVWLARDAVVLGGVTIGDGSVIGYRSLVTRSLPNNCIAVGTPARVLRKNIAWERPHLDADPPYKPDASTVTKSAYWARTAAATRTGAPPAPRGLRRRLGRIARATGLRRAR